MTEVTWGARAKGVSALVTRARTAGEPIGSLERIARVSVSPDCWWKCWLSRVCPGSLPVKLSWAGAPNLVQSVIRQATPTIQAMTVTPAVPEAGASERAHDPGPDAVVKRC